MLTQASPLWHWASSLHWTQAARTVADAGAGSKIAARVDAVVLWVARTIGWIADVGLALDPVVRAGVGGAKAFAVTRAAGAGEAARRALVAVVVGELTRARNARVVGALVVVFTVAVLRTGDTVALTVAGPAGGR